jgi:uncharacterized protein (TIRG00374 family)
VTTNSGQGDPGPASGPSGSRWPARVAIGLGLGVATFLAFGLYADFGSLAGVLAGFPTIWIIPILGLSLVNYFVRAIRWHWFLGLAGIRINVRMSIAVFFSGMALSVTPGKLGELIKVGLLSRGADVPGARSFPVVVTERLNDLVAVLGLAAVGVLLWQQNVEILLGGVLLTLVLFGVLATGPGTRFTFRMAAIVLRGKVPPEAATVAQSVQRILLAPGPLAGGVFLGLVAWFAEAAGLWLVVNGLPGGSIGLADATFIYAVGTLAGALSFLPGGLIATEATLVVLLARMAFPDTPAAEASVLAVAATMLVRLATLWFAVGLGAMALFWMGRRLARQEGMEASAS